MGENRKAPLPRITTIFDKSAKRDAWDLGIRAQKHRKKPCFLYGERVGADNDWVAFAASLRAVIEGN
jgi:hypothetical protein